MSRKSKALEFANAGYQVHVTGRHLSVTDSMKEYAIEKISKLERIMDRIIDVNVILDIQKLTHLAEIIMKAGDVKIASHASSQDIYVSIDMAVDKLEKQFLKYKSRLNDHHARAREKVDMNVRVIRPPSPLEELEEEEEVQEENREINLFSTHHIVKQEKRPLKTLRYDEAIMELDLSGDAFLVFKHETDQKLKILYRRHDGNYGIIEPH